MGLYKFAKFILKIWMKITRCKVVNQDFLSDVEPMVLYGNHNSVYDPIIIGCACPRDVHFLAKSDLFGNKFTGWLLSKLGTIPIRRNEADLRALKQSIKALKEGKVIGIFPEGTRNNGSKNNQELGEFKQGIALIAYKGNSSITPCAITNGKNLFAFWRKRPVLTFGEPIFYEAKEGEKTQAVLDQYTILAKESMVALLEEQKNY